MREQAGAARRDAHGRDVHGEVQRLRAQLERVQGRSLDSPVLPAHPALAGLLPGGGLRPGAAYSLTPSATLLTALLAPVSQQGSWCGAVGVPDFGTEAAEHGGVELSRLVLVPDPGGRWLAVTAAIAEVLPVVAVRPPSRATDGEVARLSARLRDRGAVLLVQGPWPQAEAVLEVGAPQWQGLGQGHGYVTQREVTVTARSRRWPTPRRERMLLPGADGRPVALHPARAVRPQVEPVPMRAVG
ncbi:hypothetical protein GCM10025738_15140 [Microbacterium fluvii]